MGSPTEAPDDRIDDDPAADTDAGDSDGDLRDLLGMSAKRAPAILSPGQVIDDAYRIDAELGAGGMGKVYRAHDLRLERDVAIKLHAVALAPDDDSLRREGVALARLTHPNVVHVYEVGTWAGHPWVAMEYVPGGTARSWIREAKRTPRAILALYLAAGRGLAAAHAAGLVHRDFKPDNVLVGTDGRICVADFGLARELGSTPVDASRGEHGGASEAAPSRTLTGPVIGTPAYMAPEQRAGERIDAAADQFAFAVALWEALEGARPFVGSSEAELAASAAIGRIAAPSTGRMARHVEVTLRKALSAAPADRWPSMPALLAQLGRDPVRRRRMIAAGVAAIAVVGGTGAWLASGRGGQPAITCDTAGDELATTWAPAPRTALESALGTKDPDLARRTIGAIDRWAGKWKDSRRAACEATHVSHRQSAVMLDLRIACLDRARAGLAAALDVVTGTSHGKPSATVTLDAVSTLPHVEDCADITMLAGATPRPFDLAGSGLASGADALIARARVLRLAGQAKLAVAVSRTAVTFADTLHQPAIAARARTELASATFATGERKGVLEIYEEAARLAEEAHDDVLAARSWINVLDFVALRLEKPGEAERLLVVTEAAVARAGRPPALLAELAGSRGDLAIQRGDHAAAIPLLEERIHYQERTYGATDPDLARWLNRLGSALSDLHRSDEARKALDRAARILETNFGPNHPNLGVVLTSRGALEYGTGNYAAAIAAFRRAIAIKELALGKEHVSLAATLTNLALALGDSGDHAAAIAAGTRALAIAESKLPPNHPKRGFVLGVLGNVQLQAGALADARSSLERAQKIMEADGPHPPLDEVLQNLSVIYREAGELAAARAAVDRALEISTASYGPSLQQARTLGRLAEVEQASHDVAHARRHVEQAIEMAKQAVGAEHPAVLTLERQLAALAN